MNSLTRLIAATSLCFCFQSVSAAIITNGDFTTDTDTGLDWLDLDLSLGLSLNQVNAQLGAGGLFEGYQVATLSEAQTFLTNIGWIGSFDPSNNLNTGFVASFKTQTTSFTNDPIGEMDGFLNDPLGGMYLTDDPVGGMGFTTYSFTTQVNPAIGAVDTGTFLVRSSITAVPVPAAFWLFGSCVGLLGVAKRQA